MSRTTRLLQLMQYLRVARPPVRAEDIARELEVSVRSIYRDIDALRGSGAVIDGEAGFGYTLQEDPALPPMMFSRDEMEALVLGLREVNEVGDPVLADAARNALSKIKACLPQTMRGQFDHAVLHAKRFHQRPELQIDVTELRQAARDEKIVEIAYQDGQGVASNRSVRPLAIVFMEQSLMLLAWCDLRHDYRSFRVDRIAQITVLSQSFRPRRASMLREYLDRLRVEEQNVCSPYSGSSAEH